jgi:hypothetical protein
MIALTLLLTVVEGEEASKTPFYVAGAVLVAFALIVSAIGITRKDFPASKGLRTVVSLVAAVLVAATLATAVLTG